MVTINIGGDYPRRRRRRYRSRPYRSFKRQYESGQDDYPDTGGGVSMPPPGGIEEGWGWNPIDGYNRLPGWPADPFSPFKAFAFGGGGYGGYSYMAPLFEE